MTFIANKLIIFILNSYVHKYTNQGITPLFFFGGKVKIITFKILIINNYCYVVLAREKIKNVFE